MMNVLNSQYKGEMFFGSPLSQPAMVIFDTGSNWVTVISDLCTECEQARVKYKTELSQTARQIGDEFSQQYGSAELSGIPYEDTLCLHSLQSSTTEKCCLENFPFMAVSEVIGLNEGIDGILGMGPI